MFKKAFEVRDKIKDTPRLQGWLRELRKTSERLSKTNIASYTLTEYTRYYRDGNRTEFEDKYFDRRARLASYALMVFIYRDMAYLPLLEDVIWTICEETTWVLPAHLPEDCRDYRRFLDLFASETGSALAEIKHLLSDVLSERIKGRIEKEVRERVIDPYLDDELKFGWYYCEINWSAVCSGSCAAVCMYEGSPDEARKAIDKTENIMKNFLRGFSAEGVCMEGYSYWTYGFGYFMFYADLVKEYTNGRIDRFAEDRVRSIARFVNDGLIREGTPISFSDCSERAHKCIGYESYLAALYDEIPACGVCGSYADVGRYRWAQFIRNAVWTAAYAEKAAEGEKAVYKTDIYPDAGWYIKKTPAYILCAKGGHNEEAHNHNDLGSFYIDNYRKQVLADLGSGEYTREYFDWDGGRYNIFVCGSQGHSVPIINGRYQIPGKDAHAVILEADESRFKTELAAAYDIDGLKSLVRDIVSSDTDITVTDTFKGEITEIRERFIMREEPEVCGNTIKIANAVLECDTAPEIREEIYPGSDGKNRSAWIVDYIVTGTEFKLNIKIIDA